MSASLATAGPSRPLRIVLHQRTRIASLASSAVPTPVPASHAYIHPSFSSPHSPPFPRTPGTAGTAPLSSSIDGVQDERSASGTASATASAPLSQDQRELVERIIRVDQAGELGANWIYRGQKWGSAMRGDRKTEKDVEEMWENERHHLTTMRMMQTQHGVRPTALYPVWQAMAFGLGAGTALMGRHAAMACTEAVETVIGEHYDDQIKQLGPLLKASPDGLPPHPSLPLMKRVLEEFRDDELEHLDTAVEEGAQKAPGHSLLSAVIGAGCRVAIKVCERI